VQLQQYKQAIVALARQTLTRRFVPANPLGSILACPFRLSLPYTQPM
jgi:hypothetical protein